MSVMDLLNRATGDKLKEKTKVTTGLRFEKRHMHSVDYRIVFQKAGEDDIVVSQSKVCIRTKWLKDSFRIGMNDYFIQGSECEVSSIDANGICYVINDSWMPNANAWLPDRILHSNEMSPNLYEQFVYIKRDAIGDIMLLNIDGEHTIVKAANWKNVTGIDLEYNVWYEAEVRWENVETSSVVIKCEGKTAPTLQSYVTMMLNGSKEKELMDYHFLSSGDLVYLQNEGQDDFIIPASLILMKHSDWTEYFEYGIDDYVVEGSLTKYEGLTANGRYILVNDTWDPGNNDWYADRIKRVKVTSPEQVGSSVFVKIHPNGTADIINEAGDYLELHRGNYAIKSAFALNNFMWYYAELYWDSIDKNPKVVINSDKNVPTAKDYIKEKGFGFYE